MLDEGLLGRSQSWWRKPKLFSEQNALGLQASVYDVNAKKWIAPSEPVEDIEQGKEKATEYAKTHVKRANLELPPLVWERARAA